MQVHDAGADHVAPADAPPLDAAEAGSPLDAAAERGDGRSDTANGDAQHADGSGGEDVAPQPPIDLRCATDTIDPLQPEVLLPLGAAAGGAVPLCSGWVLVAMQTPPALTYRNVLDGRSGPSIPLPGPPGQLVVDFDRQVAYVALPARNSLADVDLQTGAVNEVKVSARTAGVTLGNGGLVFVSEQPYSSPSAIAVIDTETRSVVYENAMFSAEDMTFDRANDQLVVIQGWLSRYKFDRNAKTLTPLEKTVTCGASEKRVVLSADGRHVLSGCGPMMSGFGPDYYDLSPSSLATVIGKFKDVIGIAAFSPDSAMLAAVGSTFPTQLALRIASVATHTVSSTTVPGLGCAGARVHNVAWSRGAKLIHMLVTCGFPTEPASLYAVQAK